MWRSDKYCIIFLNSDWDLSASSYPPSTCILKTQIKIPWVNLFDLTEKSSLSSPNNCNKVQQHLLKLINFIAIGNNTCTERGLNIYFEILQRITPHKSEGAWSST